MASDRPSNILFQFPFQIHLIGEATAKKICQSTRHGILGAEVSKLLALLAHIPEWQISPSKLTSVELCSSRSSPHKPASPGIFTSLGLSSASLSARSRDNPKTSRHCFGICVALGISPRRIGQRKMRNERILGFELRTVSTPRGQARWKNPTLH